MSGNYVTSLGGLKILFSIKYFQYILRELNFYKPRRKNKKLQYLDGYTLQKNEKNIFLSLSGVLFDIFERIFCL